MPEGQRAMMESMMGDRLKAQIDSQLERAVAMSAGEGMETVTTVEEIRIGDIEDYLDVVMEQTAVLE